MQLQIHILRARIQGRDEGTFVVAAGTVEQAVFVATERVPHLRVGEAFTATILGVSLVGEPRLLSYIPPHPIDKIVLFN